MMTRRIVATSMRARGLTIVVGVLVVAAGIMSFRAMPRDTLPEFSRPTVEVQTEALGLAAEEVEQLITVPLEQDLLNGVAFLDKIRSQSVPGLSRIELIFNEGTQLARARQIVNERLTQAAALPHVSAPPQMLQPLASERRVMMIRLSSTTESLTDLGVLARWTIRTRLMGVPGVADVAIWGQRERQIQVQVDPANLRDRGVSLEQVISTTGNALWWSPLGRLEANTPGSGGFVDGAQQRLGILHESPIKTAADLADVALEPATERGTPATGTPLKLGDVATLASDHQPLVGDAVFGDGDGLMLVVEKMPEANVANVTKDLDEALDELRPGLTGVTVDASVFRPEKYVQDAIGNVLRAMLIGILLVAAVLLLFLREWRTAFISVISIVLALLVAVAVLAYRGVSLNAMVLAGLVLAMAIVVDDVVVVTETVRRRLREHHPDLGTSTELVVTNATTETRGPAMYATLVLLLAVLPIAALHGETGAFLPEAARVYAVAIVATLLVVITVTPLLCLLLFRGRALDHRDSPPVAGLLRVHDRVASRLLMSPMRAIGVAVALAVVGLVAMPFVTRGDSLVPAFKDRAVLASIEGAPGTSLPEMSRVIGRMSREVQALPGIKGVGAHVGRAIGGDQIVGTSSAEMWITMAGSASYAKTLDSIRSVVGGYPGFVTSVSTYPGQRIKDLLGSTSRDLTVRVYGEDLAVIAAKAAEVADAMKGIKGVVKPVVHNAPTEPGLDVQVDIAAADKYGIKPGDARRAVTTLVSGLTVGALFEEQKVFDVVVLGTPETRADITGVQNLLIESPTGQHVRLGDIATVKIAPTLSVIRHEDVSRYVDVDAAVSGRSVDAVARDVNAALKNIEFPVQHRAIVLRDYTRNANQRRNFLALAAASAIGIFLLMQAAFRSWRLAFVYAVTLPTAVAGGVVGSLVAGPFSFGSVLGFLAVFGVAARACVLLVSRFQDLERREVSTERIDLVRRGTRDALGTIIGSVLAIAVALVPFVVLSNLAGYEIAHRMAVVVLCGLVSTAIYAALVVPALYLRLGKRAGLDPAELLRSELAAAAVAAVLPPVAGNGGQPDVQTIAGRENP